MQQILSYVPIALLAIVALILVINIVKALIRGLKKTVGTLIAIVFSAIVAMIVTMIVCKPDSALMTWLVNMLKGLLSEGEIASLLEIESLGITVSYYATMLIAPIFFTACYAVLSIIFAIVVAILVKLVPPFGKPGAVLNRLGGVGVGLVCGILVSVLLMMPIVGMLGAVAAVDMQQLTGDSGENSETAELVEGINGITAHPVVTVLDKMGGSALYDFFASAKFEGERVYLREDLGVILGMLENVKTLNGNVADYDDTQISALRSVVSEMDKSPLLANTVAGVFSTASQKWLAGETFIGMAKFSAGELFDPVIDELLSVMSTSDTSTIAADLNTMIDIFAIVIDSGILKEGGDYEAMLQKLGDGVISDLLLTIHENERMAPLADEVTALSIRALASSIGLPEDADEQYDQLMTDIAGILQSTSDMSEEERAVAVNESLTKTLDDYGVEVKGEAAENVTESILADLGDLEQVEASDVEEFFIVYGIAAADSEARANGNGYSFDLLSEESDAEMVITENGTIVVGGRELENYTASSYMQSSAYLCGATGVDFGGAATLISADAMESAIVTLKDIMDAIGSFAEIEDIEAEAEMIGSVIAEASQVLAEVDFENSEPEELLDQMGGLLDKMKATTIFGTDATKQILIALLQVDSVTSSLGISESKAAEFANKLSNIADKKDDGYTDALTAVTKTMNALNASKDPDKSAEEKKQASKEMIEIMSSENADMLSTLLDSGLVSNKGASEEKADNVSQTMDQLLKNMADYKATDPDDEDMAREAEAVNSVLTIAMSGGENEDKPLFSTEETQGVVDSTPDEFIDTVVNSTSIMKTVEDVVYEKEMNDNPLGISDLSTEEEEQVVAALENYYAENGGGEELEKKLEAIATVINVKIDIE